MFQDLPPPPVIEEIAPDDEQAMILQKILRPDEILVTASLERALPSDSSTATTIIDRETVERLDEESAVGLLRLLPSAAIAETGPRGTQTQLRIRGAEASHTLLFIDGIKANDPAAGNEARFELATAGLYDFVEYARGPRSALWGSEALGGVVALRSLTERDTNEIVGSAEAGSFDTQRADARLNLDGAAHQLVLVAGGQRSEGIDSFGDGGERDGFSNLHARVAGSITLAPHTFLKVSGFAIDAYSEFDGYDPATFLRADTQDRSDNRLGAVRAEIETHVSQKLRLTVGGDILASSNINSLAMEEINRTAAERYMIDAKASYDFATAGLVHRFTVSIDREAEDFRADDVAYGGFTAQDVGRERTGISGEWVARTDNGVAGLQVAFRHDDFSDFADAFSLSAGGHVRISGPFSFVANYGEGIAQPSFYDLYGFFPGSFVGNPDLKPETSAGYDVGFRFEQRPFSASALWFRQELKDEIVDVFDTATFFSTTANGEGKSVREGVEFEASWTPSDALSVQANYSFLDAQNPEAADGTRLRETRRPKHRAALYATGSSGSIDYGASLTFVGSRFDDDFDLFPAARVKLDTYALLSARLGWRLSDRIELSLRGTNLTDSDYQDVVGYNTQGSAVFAGIRITG